MTTQRHQKDWEELGDLDPMWAVASRPGMENNRWDPEEFYATGRRIVEAQRNNLREAGCPDHYDRVLDFGCGLGRLSYAWAPHAGEVVGVDIARPMVEKATAAGRATNCQFQHNPDADLRLFPDASFDLVVSEVVLQHIPDRAVILRYIEEFARVTRPGGVIYFQLPSRLPLSLRFKFRRPLYHALSALGASPSFLYRVLRVNPMKMNAVPSADVLGVLARDTAPRALLHPEAVATTYIHQRR